MFDIGFSELLIIAVVALIVIGPERLPKVARTVGHLLGRLQRYVGDVKSDIEREMRLDEMKKLQAEVENQARGIESQVHNEMRGVEESLAQPVAPLAEMMQTTGQTVNQEVAELSAAVQPDLSALAAPAPVTDAAAVEMAAAVEAPASTTALPAATSPAAAAAPELAAPTPAVTDQSKSA